LASAVLFESDFVNELLSVAYFAGINALVKGILDENFEKVDYHSTEKASPKEFTTVMYKAMNGSNIPAVTACSTLLKSAPITQWPPILDEAITKMGVADVDSAAKFLQNLMKSKDLTDVRVPASLGALAKVGYDEVHPAIRLVLNLVPNAPNKRQFIIAQHTVYRTHAKPGSPLMWHIESGQGKSRMVATTALIALDMFPALDVYCIFNN
jgi:hypothetical protein